MNNYNGFDLIIAVVFSMIPQLGVIGTKIKDLVISFRLGEVDTLPLFQLGSLQIRSEIFLFLVKTGQISNLTCKYIMELSKLKNIQRYMTPFELCYRKFECIPKIHQLSTTFTPTPEEVFETLYTAYIGIKSSHSIIEPIVNRNFWNTFQRQNGPNQHQHTQKNTSQRY